METAYPYDAAVTLTLEELASPSAFAVALRIPGWCEGAALAVNGKPQPIALGGGTPVVRRRWIGGGRPASPLPRRPRPAATVANPSDKRLCPAPSDPPRGQHN